MADEKGAKLVMAWSCLIDSMQVSVRALKEGGGFVKILDKNGLTMVDSSALTFVYATKAELNPAGLTEVPETFVSAGKTGFVDALAKAGITCNEADIKLRVFPVK